MTCPIVDGTNCTAKLTVWPALIVTGNEGPDSAKPLPVSVAEVTVSGAVPEEARVTD